MSSLLLPIQTSSRFRSGKISSARAFVVTFDLRSFDTIGCNMANLSYSVKGYLHNSTIADLTIEFEP